MTKAGARPIVPGVFVTGTDTGVGKTRVTAGLVRALTALGCRTSGLKPVVSGVLHAQQEAADSALAEPWWEDLDALAQAGGPAMPDALRAVVRLDLPASPHLAAQRQGRVLGMDELLQGVREASSLMALQFSVVEGVGGFCVPLAPGLDTAQFAQALGLPVLLVVGLRLGCINHALLTAEAIRARGLELSAWVANGGVDAGYAYGPETVEAIEEGLKLACSATVGVLPAARAEAVRTKAERAVFQQALDRQASQAAEDLAQLARHFWPEATK